MTSYAIDISCSVYSNFSKVRFIRSQQKSTHSDKKYAYVTTLLISKFEICLLRIRPGLNFIQKKQLAVITSTFNSLSKQNTLFKYYFVSDKRFDLNDPMISKFQLMLIDIFVEFNGKGLALLDAYPILETLIPRIAYKILGVASYIEKSDKFLDYIDVSLPSLLYVNVLSNPVEK